MFHLDAALSLAAKGCRVFPILATGSGKKPGIRRWQWLATSDTDQVRRWWTTPRFRAASVGIHPVGLLVIDVDGPTGAGAVRRLSGSHPLPATLKVLSGRTDEGDHYQLIYRLPDGVRAVPRPLDAVPGFEAFDKIDVRGSGGQVVGPGSVHKTGGVYRWEREPEDVHAEASPAPQWALDHLCGPEKYVLRPPAETGTEEDLVQAVLQRFPVTGPGQRHHLLRSAVLWLAGWGHPPDLVVRVMTRWAGCYQTLIGSTPAEAHAELLRCATQTQDKLDRGELDHFIVHQKRAAELELPAHLQRWIETLCRPTAPKGETEQESTTNWLCSPYSRFTEGEQRFLCCLVLHALYERQTKEPSETFLMTDRQILAIHEHKFAKKLGWKSFYVMKRKFVTTAAAGRRPQKAIAKELLVMEQAGRLGQASVYRLAGLDAALRTVS